jgi:hypothetical protein
MDFSQGTHNALQTRISELLRRARRKRAKMETSRCLKLGVSLASLACVAPLGPIALSPIALGPIALVPATIALGMYVTTLFRDWTDTGELYLLPLLRKTPREWFSRWRRHRPEIGEPQDLAAPYQHPQFQPLIRYLSAWECDELLLLINTQETLAQQLDTVHQAERSIAYQRALQHHFLPMTYILDEESEWETERHGDSRTQTVAIADPKTRLQNLVQSHEGGWVEQLLERSLLVVGAPSPQLYDMVAGIALLRQILLGHHVEVCDPHGHRHRRFWQSFTLYGSHGDYRQISRRLQVYYQHLSQPQTPSKPHKSSSESQPFARTSLWAAADQYAHHLPKHPHRPVFGPELRNSHESQEFAIVLTPSLMGLLGTPLANEALEAYGLTLVHPGHASAKEGEPMAVWPIKIQGLRSDATALPSPTDAETTHPSPESYGTIPEWLRASWLIEQGWG